MSILRLYSQLIHDASKMNGYAIMIIALIIFLIISYYRRKSAQSAEEESKTNNQQKADEINAIIKESETLKRDYENTKKELIQSNNKIRELILTINNNQSEISKYQGQQDEYKSNISKLKDTTNKIRHKFSQSYEELLHAREDKKNKENQLRAYQLSPHILKNFLNKAFLESKMSFEDSFSEVSFSFFGIKFYSSNKIKKAILKNNEIINTSIPLLIGTLDYLIYSNTTNKVHLEIEISQLENFCRLIEIQKGIKIEIIKNIETNINNISPTILFNYIDNAIKHGYYKSRGIKINLNCIQNKLRYTVETPIHKDTDENKILGGIGNKDFEQNLKTSDNKYKVSNKIVENTYIAELQLNL